MEGHNKWRHVTPPGLQTRVSRAPPREPEVRGLATRMVILCTSCGYISLRYTLYEEVETKSQGWKAAAIYLGLQVGLSQTPLGNVWMRKILLSNNTPLPSRKSARKCTKLLIKSKQANYFSLMREKLPK